MELEENLNSTPSSSPKVAAADADADAGGLSFALSSPLKYTHRHRMDLPLIAGRF